MLTFWVGSKIDCPAAEGTSDFSLFIIIWFKSLLITISSSDKMRLCPKFYLQSYNSYLYSRQIQYPYFVLLYSHSLYHNLQL